jgi:hypothetical protein
MAFDISRPDKANWLGKLGLAAIVLGCVSVSGGSALAQAAAPASNCQTDFEKVMAPRQALIARINGFRNKRPTPVQACSTLGQLVSADGRLKKWLNENKDWCQIPDSLIEQLDTSSGQAATSRNQACAAAKNYASQVARARAAQARSQQGGAAPVGSGVRLPQGAL